MRISDWSSDVCSSDLDQRHQREERSGSRQPFDPGPPRGSHHCPRQHRSPSDKQAVNFPLGTIDLFERQQGIGKEIDGNSSRKTGNNSDIQSFDKTERSEEHTSELQTLMSNSYAVLCLKKNKHNKR